MGAHAQDPRCAADPPAGETLEVVHGWAALPSLASPHRGSHTGGPNVGARHAWWVLHGVATRAFAGKAGPRQMQPLVAQQAKPPGPSGCWFLHGAAEAGAGHPRVAACVHGGGRRVSWFLSLVRTLGAGVGQRGRSGRSASELRAGRHAPPGRGTRDGARRTEGHLLPAQERAWWRAG
jgi:hypothetical protein